MNALVATSFLMSFILLLSAFFTPAILLYPVVLVYVVAVRTELLVSSKP